jgi:hypothetical protein
MHEYGSMLETESSKFLMMTSLSTSLSDDMMTRSLSHGRRSTVEISTTSDLPAIASQTDQVKEDELGRACSTNGGEEECI